MSRVESKRRESSVKSRESRVESKKSKVTVESGQMSQEQQSTGICTTKYLGTTEYQSYLFSVKNLGETCKILYSCKYILILVLIDT